jgi:hypothetical protein
MRLDGLGKPTILKVVPEPKKTVGEGDAQSNSGQVKKVSNSAAGSFSSTGQEKLGQIIEILARAKKENSKKKKRNLEATLQVIEEYKRVENNYQRQWNLAPKERGDKLDIKG